MKQKIFSIIIPVKDEEQFYIKRVVKNIKRVFKNSKYEIIFAKTQKEKIFLKDSFIKFINSPQGRGVQLNTGAKLAKGDILIFLHCDTILPEAAEKLILENLENNVILSFKYSTYPGKFFLKFIEFFTNLRCFFSKTPYGDQCYIMYRELFEKIGGYPEQELEDVKFIKKAKQNRVRIKILNSKIKTSPRRYYREGFLETMVNNRITIMRYLINEFFKNSL